MIAQNNLRTEPSDMRQHAVTYTLSVSLLEVALLVMKGASCECNGKSRCLAWLALGFIVFVTLSPQWFHLSDSKDLAIN
jgi:hypothetical protein